MYVYVYVYVCAGLKSALQAHDEKQEITLPNAHSYTHMQIHMHIHIR